jgi:hypothetical protein
MLRNRELISSASITARATILTSFLHFANPLLSQVSQVSQGILIGRHSFDSTRRTMDFNLKLGPKARISPFLVYSRNSSFGPGITTYAADRNEFAVNNDLRDASDYYRGGVMSNLPRVSLALEQGTLTFKDDQRRREKVLN